MWSPHECTSQCVSLSSNPNLKSCGELCAYSVFTMQTLVNHFTRRVDWRLNLKANEKWFVLWYHLCYERQSNDIVWDVHSTHMLVLCDFQNRNAHKKFHCLMAERSDENIFLWVNIINVFLSLLFLCISLMHLSHICMQ